MLTVSGCVFIMSDPFEKQVKNGSYFNFDAVAKNPYGEGVKHYKIAIYATAAESEKARDKLKKGIAIQLRIAELDGKQTETGTIFMQINTKWSWIEVLKMIPSKDKDK